MAILIAFLEKSGRIDKGQARPQPELAGLKLDTAGELTARTGLPRAPATSHRRGKSAPKPRVVNFAELERIPLPRSPVRWELDQDFGRQVGCAIQGCVRVRDAAWRRSRRLQATAGCTSRSGLSPALSVGASGMLLVDDLGKAEAFPEAPAAVQRYGVDGELAGVAPLTRDNISL